MIFKVPFLISYISSIMTLMEGDVILTGTPEGVGPVRIGQKIKAGITGLIEAEFDVQRRSRTFSPWCSKQENYCLNVTLDLICPSTCAVWKWNKSTVLTIVRKCNSARHSVVTYYVYYSCKLEVFMAWCPSTLLLPQICWYMYLVLLSDKAVISIFLQHVAEYTFSLCWINHRFSPATTKLRYWWRNL